MHALVQLAALMEKIRQDKAKKARLAKTAEMVSEVLGEPVLTPGEEPKTPLPRGVGRNAKCPCGSGAKFKNCCLKIGSLRESK